ncbi:MAG: hypothetical protein JNG82_01645 [Opitutaceae bacterium]|nr:hypothetical protein [Opitutaceae bacterium]
MREIILWLLLCSSACATTRILEVSAPGSVTAGQSFTVSTWASTDAGDGEQIGFYHGQYSTDGGATWAWFTADVNLGTSAARNAYITAGGAGSTIIVWAKIAFRDGGSGDVAYDGSAIDWGGSWDANLSPPAKFAYISVVAPPNQPPIINWIQNPPSVSVSQWFAIQARGNDPDGNLANVWVWKEWVPFAVNDGGNGYERYSDANMTYGGSPGSINFQSQSFDVAGASSAVIFHTVSVYTPNSPPRVTISASPTSIYFGQTTGITAVATDAEGQLAFHGVLASSADGSSWYQAPGTDHTMGWGTFPASNDFLSVNYSSGAASGGSSTRTATHRPSYTGLPRTITYHTNAHDGIVWASSDPANWASCIGYAYVTVNKATPAGAFTSRSFTPTGPTYTVQSSDLNASFANPYSTAVATPTGAPAYTLVGPGTTLSAGSALPAGTSSTVRATYPGDSNYGGTYVEATWSVARASQTINFPTPSNKIYGDAPFALSATSSSGLAVGFSIVAGPATVSGGIMTITGTGLVTVRASQAGDSTYNVAADVDRSFSVSKATLLVKADDKSRLVGAANPAFTYAITGYVYGETGALVSGAPSLTTTATAASPAGSYAINVGTGTLSAANYQFSCANGVLTVNALAVIQYTYDASGRLIQAKYLGVSTQDFSLSSAGNLTQVSTTQP